MTMFTLASYRTFMHMLDVMAIKSQTYRFLKNYVNFDSFNDITELSSVILSSHDEFRTQMKICKKSELK